MQKEESEIESLTQESQYVTEGELLKIFSTASFTSGTYGGNGILLNGAVVYKRILIRRK